MKPLLLFVLSLAAVFCFEWGLRLCARKFGPPSSPAQWCGFFWSCGFLLCGICFMPPIDARTMVDWSPVFLVAFSHMQQSHQREIVSRITNNAGGKP